MRVILLQDLRNLGKRGDEVDVKPGYGRNYLIPQGMALQSSQANRAFFEQQREKIDARHAKMRDEALAIAEKLTNVKIMIAKRVGDSGTLYGSVTSMDITAALEAKDIQVDRRRLDLDGGIKTVGDHVIRVDLHPEVIAELTVSVVSEAGDEAPPPEAASLLEPGETMESLEAEAEAAAEGETAETVETE